ncbi:MAG: hypothetical protein HWN81_09255 [Candidatus Lokiarchaeota archaeon]|nr:hypothetical protein [Candidatus Lokiarchaeota archaeon]
MSEKDKEEYGNSWISDLIIEKVLKDINMSRETLDKIIPIISSIADSIEFNEGKKGYSIKFKKDISIYIDK